MKYDIKQIQEKIEIERKKMDQAIENGEDYAKILEISTYIDTLITEYLDAETNIIDKRKNIMTKYENLIETPFKNEIIGQIRTEVRQKFPTMGIQELLQFSTNVYTYSILKIHNTPEQEIVNQLMFLNNKFLNATKNDDEIVIGKEIEQPTLEYLQNLISKYEIIIKERI